MKRTLGIAALVAAAVAVLLYLRCGRERGAGDPATAGSAAPAAPGGGGDGAAARSRPRPDPKTLTRGSIAGAITDPARAPVPQARVCADGSSDDLPEELLRDPSCAVTDAQGRYQIDGLYPARYTVSAAARPFRPGVHHPGGDRRKSALALAAGERRTGVDITLQAGGVELTGAVADATGGPIAGARIAVRPLWRAQLGTAYGDSDEHGRFSLWVAPGSVQVTASAEGYADAEESGQAPGKIDLLLTPESSLAGVVVDAATGQPVAGAQVSASTSEWMWDTDEVSATTNDQGQFRVARLRPGRHVVAARAERGYGRSEGSVLVGLGQHVEGVVVKLFAAARLEGKILIAATKAPCEDGSVVLSDPARRDRWVAFSGGKDGRPLWAEGVLPGTYDVRVTCRGYAQREKYPPVVVAGKDLTDLVWEVDPGGTLRGKVLTKAGGPIEDAWIRASTVGGNARAQQGWASDTAGPDGAYELTGLRPGTYRIDVETRRAVAPKDGFKIEVAAGAATDRDLVLDDGGAIRGTVVDPEGKPVRGVGVTARALSSSGFSFSPGGTPKSDDAGAFAIEPLAAGDYRVLAQRGWFDDLRKPGTTDDAKQGERVTVRVGQTATVRLVVEAQSGAIKGAVVDAAGKPVADAFVSVVRESDAAGARASSVSDTRWTWGERPVVTSVDGAFTVTGLSPGKYTVRAYRKGGGEAVAEHVPAGGTARLQIKATGSIEGTARRAGGPPDEITVSVTDPATGIFRREQFFRTAGRFAVRDLPGGHFRLQIESTGGQKQIELDLAEGEAKTGVDVELEALLELTGRVVEHGTGKPVAGIMMTASLARGGRFTFSPSDAARENVTDEAGRFKIANAPTGQLAIRGFPKDFRDSDYTFFSVIRKIEPGATDLGDIPILKRRVKPGEPTGELGVNFAQQPPDTAPEQRERKVSFIDPAGPAAKTELRVGDVITTVDGLEVGGINADRFGTLVRAPPGTRLTLGLARGATVIVTLAAP